MMNEIRTKWIEPSPWEKAERHKELAAMLKTCPFDGGKAEHNYIQTYSCDSSYYVIGCTTCSCQMVVNEYLSEADVAEWNKRV